MMIPHQLPDSSNNVTLDILSAEYIQESDCCSTADEYQTLKLYTADGGGGVYIIMETKRWAFENVDEIVKVLNDFLKRTNTHNIRIKIEDL